MKKKVICTIMILNLIILPCYHVYADAGTLTVAGGSISVGGLGAGAVAGLAGPAVVAVFCGMLAVGMDIELTKASQEAGMTKTEFLKTKINQYCQEANTTAEIFYNGIANNMAVTKTGAIELGNEASLQVKQFINWLFNSNLVNAPSTGGTGELGSVNISNKEFPVLQQGQSINITDVVSATVTKSEFPLAAFARRYDRYIYDIYFFTSESVYTNASDKTVNLSTSMSYSGTDSFNGYRYFAFRVVDYNKPIELSPDIPNMGTATFIDIFNSFDGSWNPEMSAGVTSDGFTGDRDEWNEKQGVYDPSQGWPTTINPGLIGQIPIPADTDITTNVREYLDALQRVLDGIADNVIQGIDSVDGIPRDWEIPDTATINPDITKNPPLPNDDITPVTNDDPVNPDKTPSIAMEPLKFDLRNIFPFCIPFDIKDLISLLEEEPEAPKYTVDWIVPFINTHLTFTVDLEPWDDVAVICRRMELILFAFGLMLATRKLIGS